MREIKASLITETISRLCIEANCHLSGDMKQCITDCRACETWPVAQDILDQISIKNPKEIFSLEA